MRTLSDIVIRGTCIMVLISHITIQLSMAVDFSRSGAPWPRNTHDPPLVGNQYSYGNRFGSRVL